MPLPILRFVPYALGVIAIWLVSSMERPPVPEELVFWNSDKLLHMIAYAGLASLATIAVRRHLQRAPAIIFAMAAGYGLVDEIHQSFVPGRSSSPFDLIADAAGAALIACAFAYVRRRRQAPA